MRARQSNFCLFWKRNQKFFSKNYSQQAFCSQKILSKIFLEKFSYFNRCYPLKFPKKKIFFKKTTTKILSSLQNLWMVLRTLSNANEKFFYDILGLKQGRALKILKIRIRPYSCGCFLCVKLISKEKFFCDILCSKERAAENATDPKK